MWATFQFAGTVTYTNLLNPRIPLVEMVQFGRQFLLTKSMDVIWTLSLE